MSSLPQLFGARFRGRHEERKTAFRELQNNFKSPYKNSWRPRAMFWAFKTFSIIIQLHSKRIGVRRHANQKISTKTRLLLKNKKVQNVFSSDIPLNCHFDKKNTFFHQISKSPKIVQKWWENIPEKPQTLYFHKLIELCTHDKYFLKKKMKKCILGSLIFTHHGSVL